MNRIREYKNPHHHHLTVWLLHVLLVKIRVQQGGPNRLPFSRVLKVNKCRQTHLSKKKILYFEYTTVRDTKYSTIIDMDSQILLIKWHRGNIHQKVLRITGRVSRVVKARESFSPSYSALFPFGELRQVMFAAANLILIPLKECKTSRMYNISSGFSFLSFSIL